MSCVVDYLFFLFPPSLYCSPLPLLCSLSLVSNLSAFIVSPQFWRLLLPSSVSLFFSFASISHPLLYHLSLSLALSMISQHPFLVSHVFSLPSLPHAAPSFSSFPPYVTLFFPFFISLLPYLSLPPPPLSSLYLYSLS